MAKGKSLAWKNSAGTAAAKPPLHHPHARGLTGGTTVLMADRNPGLSRRISYAIERAMLARGKTQRAAPNTRPRDAAVLIAVDTAGQVPRILMGRRHAAMTFVPDVYVFPGGSVEPEDYEYALESDLKAAVAAKLTIGMRPRGAIFRARALAVAALREAYEEAGVSFCPFCSLAKLAGDVPAFSSLPLNRLTLIARAITPPFQKRRFDTRFLAIDARGITLSPKTDGELSNVGWLTFEEAQSRNLHIMTRTILGDLEHRLECGGLSIQAPAIPIYFKRGSSFQRRLI
jgi:8-oxo-dGTP pyrophosphatase MutT (NUDIX family)